MGDSRQIGTRARTAHVHVRAVAWHASVARVSAHECSALSVCVRAVVHVVTQSFSARGEITHRSPLAERGDCHTPTLRVDTRPPQERPTYTHTPQSVCCPNSANLPGSEA